MLNYARRGIGAMGLDDLEELRERERDTKKVREREPEDVKFMVH